MSEEQIHLISHALGFAQRGVRYRNNYVANAEGSTAKDWRDLVARGFATEKPYALGANMVIFQVTKSGIDEWNRARRCAA